MCVKIKEKYSGPLKDRHCLRTLSLLFFVATNRIGEERMEADEVFADDDVIVWMYRINGTEKQVVNEYGITNRW